MRVGHGLRVDAVLVQAVIAGALSFAHLHDLAAAAGQDGWKAWAYPISVDLLLVASWRRLRSAGPTRLAWCWFLVALFASLGANVATAGFLDMADPPALLRLGIAGWPALAFLGGTLLAHSPAAPKPIPSASVDATEEAESTVELVPVAERELATEVVSEPDASPAPVEKAPASPAPAPPVPAVLIDHARKIADEYRARTGSPIDTATLRSRLGVPPHLADAIAAHLT
ncbi:MULTISPECIES: DUF2637 domain-containing protein [unclassified Streptomyces]|uniref:DUF2637 domain-containing protein n=1 Tax=unclassified Streptomyces TaxID=2593676 RepID=UPI00094006C1|nr:DUF2637 domain-containing protein [Streptomyces sp. CB01580]OKJ34490.1 SpdA protein [Streptomyces sp. CB01580]